MTFSDCVRTVLESSFSSFLLSFLLSFFLSSLRLRLDSRKSPQRSLRFHRRGAATPVKALFRLGSTGTTILNVSVGVRARENQYSGSKNDAKKGEREGKVEKGTSSYIPSESVFARKRIVTKYARKVAQFQMDLCTEEWSARYWYVHGGFHSLLTLCSCRIRSVRRTNLRSQPGYRHACGCSRSGS